MGHGFCSYVKLLDGIGSHMFTMHNHSESLKNHEYYTYNIHKSFINHQSLIIYRKAIVESVNHPSVSFQGSPNHHQASTSRARTSRAACTWARPALGGLLSWICLGKNSKSTGESSLCLLNCQFGYPKFSHKPKCSFLVDNGSNVVELAAT